MPTYRCESCKGVYVDPQNGVHFPHVCPPTSTDAASGKIHRRPDERDENRESVGVFGKLIEGTPDQQAAAQKTRIRKAGKGRVKLDDADLVTGADAAAIATLQQQAGVADPDV
jgi:hypothetical protein